MGTPTEVPLAASTGPPHRAAKRQFLSVAEFARICGVSRRLIYKLARPGGPLPAVRIGKRVLLPRASVTAMITHAEHDAQGAGSSPT